MGRSRINAIGTNKNKSKKNKSDAVSASNRAANATQEALYTAARAANETNSLLCNPQLRDPLTIALSFMANTIPVKRVCHFVQSCVYHTQYLEGQLWCNSIFLSNKARTVGMLVAADADEQRVVTLDSDTVPCAGPEDEEIVVGGGGGESPAAGGGGGGESDPSRTKARAMRARAMLNDLGLLEVEESDGDEPRTRLVSGDLPSTRGKFGGLTDLVIRGLAHLETIESYCTSGCIHLTNVTVCRLPKLETIGGAFLADCPQLTHVTLEDLPELTSIEYCFLKGSAIESFQMVGFPKLQSVGSFWLSECPRLKRVQISNLPELRSVEDNWMSECPRLESVRLSDLPRLTEIGYCFLNESTALQEIYFQDLPELSEFGDSSLTNCTNLQKLHFSHVPKLRSVGCGFMGQGPIVSDFDQGFSATRNGARIQAKTVELGEGCSTVFVRIILSK